MEKTAILVTVHPEKRDLLVICDDSAQVEAVIDYAFRRGYVIEKQPALPLTAREFIAGPETL